MILVISHVFFYIWIFNFNKVLIHVLYFLCLLRVFLFICTKIYVIIIYVIILKYWFEMFLHFVYIIVWNQIYHIIAYLILFIILQNLQSDNYNNVFVHIFYILGGNFFVWESFGDFLLLLFFNVYACFSSQFVCHVHTSVHRI